MSPTSRYAYSFRLPVERRAVFELFADPRHLDLLTPPWFRLLPLGQLPERLDAGSEISYRLRWRGLPFRWTSRMTDWREPEFFAYEQRRGPYRFFRHEHLFADVAGGTQICDRVLFRAPGGRLADRLIAEPDLRRIFAFRERRARELFSRAAGHSVPGHSRQVAGRQAGARSEPRVSSPPADRSADRPEGRKPAPRAQASAAAAGGASRMPWTSASSSAIERPT